MGRLGSVYHGIGLTSGMLFNAKLCTVQVCSARINIIEHVRTTDGIPW